MSEEFDFQGARRRRSNPPASRPAQELQEGIFNQKSGTTDIDRAVSLTKIRATDLLSEGEIAGLATGDYRYTVASEGQTGYTTAEFVPYPSVSLNGESRKDLGSIYYNEVPVVDAEGKFNFQQFDFVFDPGSPLPTSKTSITNPDGEGLSVVRTVNERLRGPNQTIDSNGTVIEVGQEDLNAKFYRILNPLCSSAIINIRFNALFEVNRTGPKTIPPGAAPGDGYGDTTSSDVKIKVYFREIFATNQSAVDTSAKEYTLAKTEIVEGKISQPYLQTIDIDFNPTEDQKTDPSFLGYELKVVRTTPDGLTRDISNTTFVDSLIEYYDDKFGYPSSAIASSKFNSEFFSSIPARSFKVDLLKVKIPSNYDPIKKTYDGDWDGTFNTNKFWTDNPAWCFYDMLSNKRYGLGDYIDVDSIDKWTLYKIAQYCDTMVPNGEGGYEPRFSCNLYITDKLEAFQAVQDFASIFRGLTYFMGGTIKAFQDAPDDPLYTFTNSNIEGGEFNYQGSAKKARFNTIVVRYNDEKNFYQPAIEVVEDFESIRRNGVIRKEIVGIGITKKSQARRIGKWTILSDNLETEDISFRAGLEGAFIQPGDVINVSDNTKTSKRYAGRIAGLSGDQNSPMEITLDSAIPLSGSELYEFSLATPTYDYNTSLVIGLTSSDLSGIRRKQVQTFDFLGNTASIVTGADNIARTIITGSGILDTVEYNLSGNNVFTIHSSGVIDKNPDDLYRVITVKEEEVGKYDINAISHKPEKFSKADNAVEVQNLANYDPPEPPEDFILNVSDIIQDDPRFKKIDYSIGTTGSGVNSFVLYAKQGNWVGADFSQRTSAVVDASPDSNHIIDFKSFDGELVEGSFVPSGDGDYFFRVYSRNKNGILSETCNSGTSPITVTQGDLITNITVSNLSLINNTGVNNNESPQKVTDRTTESSPGFIWNIGFKQEDITIDTSNMFFRVSVREPSDENSPIPSPVVYFEQTGIPFSQGEAGFTYTFDYGDNASGSAKFVDNGRPFTAYNDYSFPRPEQIAQSAFFETGVSFISGSNGPFRNFDLVIEAHDRDGLSSVGYNISTQNEGSGTNSVYFNTANSQGFDIIRIQNNLPAQVILTPSIWRNGCLAAIEASQPNSFNSPYDPNAIGGVGRVYDDFDNNYPTDPVLGAKSKGPTNFCTEQHLELNGEVSFYIYRDDKEEVNLDEMDGFKDVAGGVLYYSDKWFDSNKAKDATYANDTFGVLEATGIVSNRPTNPSEYASEFATTEPITGTVNKVGFFVDRDTFINEEKMTIPVNINASKKYIAFSFVDEFETDQVNRGIISTDAIVSNSAQYEVSPANLVLRRGEPDSRTTFRSYLTMKGIRKHIKSYYYTYSKYTEITVQHIGFKFYHFGIQDGSFEIKASLPVTIQAGSHTSYVGRPIRGQQYPVNGYVHPVYLPNDRIAYEVSCTLNNPIPSQSRIALTSNKDVYLMNSTDPNELKFRFQENTKDFFNFDIGESIIVNGSQLFDRFVGTISSYTRGGGEQISPYDYYVLYNQNDGAFPYGHETEIDRELVSLGILWNGIDGLGDDNDSISVNKVTQL